MRRSLFGRTNHGSNKTYLNWQETCYAILKTDRKGKKIFLIDTPPDLKWNYTIHDMVLDTQCSPRDVRREKNATD